MSGPLATPPLAEKTLRKKEKGKRKKKDKHREDSVASHLRNSPTAMATTPQLSASASASFYAVIPTYVCASSSARAVSAPRLPISRSVTIRTPFVSGSPLLICRSSRKSACRATSVSIRCEQSANEGNSLDVWLGRLAMVGFAVAISIEIATGKGLLENFGLTSPLPTVALAVTALVGVLTAIFIFQSASKN